MRDVLRNSYNKDAKNYDDKFEEHQTIKYKLMTENYLNEFKNTKKILDLGCGSGLFNNFLKQHNIFNNEFYGIDFSEKLLKIAKKRRVRTINGDITALPFKDNSFNIITSFTVLNIIPENDFKTLLEIKRVLIQNGLLIITILNNHNNSNFVENLLKSNFRILKSTNCGQDIGFWCNTNINK